MGLDKYLFRLSFGCFLFCSFLHFLRLLCKLLRFLSGPLRGGGVKLLLHVYVGGIYPKAVSVRNRIRSGALGRAVDYFKGSAFLAVFVDKAGGLCDHPEAAPVLLPPMPWSPS